MSKDIDVSTLVMDSAEAGKVPETFQDESPPSGERRPQMTINTE